MQRPVLLALAIAGIGFVGCDWSEAEFDFSVNDNTPLPVQQSITQFDGIPHKPDLRVGRVDRYENVELKLLGGYQSCAGYEVCVFQAVTTFTRQYDANTGVSCQIVALDDRVNNIQIYLVDKHLFCRQE